MKTCALCGQDAEAVTVVQVVPAGWNAFNSYAEVCGQCQLSRRFQMWARSLLRPKGGAAAARAAAAAAQAEAAAPAVQPGAQVEISHRRTGASLRTVESPTLAGADLSGAQLSGADLQHAGLRGADLHQADLHLADLAGADLRGADLRAVNFRGANLCGADLREARLHRADLRNCLYDPRTLWPAGFDPCTSGAEQTARR
jgi:hypothetical protein